jgi:hypothetical protein
MVRDLGALVAAGEELDLEAVAALADHGCLHCWSCLRCQKNDRASSLGTL